MKKITFNTLPEAISELIVRIEKIEKILSRKSSPAIDRPANKKRKNKRQETPAGLLSVKEAGKFLKMSLVNLYSYVKNKKIPFEKKGRRLFFSKTALENWMKTRNQQINSADNITIKDAEKLLKVSATTIYYKIRSKKLKPAARRGNKLYFSKKELINAFSTPAKRGRKATKSLKPAKAKTAKASKTSKPVKAVKAKKSAKATKRGRPAKQAQPPKPEVNGTKPAQPAKAAKPAPAKAAKPAPAKAAKPAPAKAAKPAAEKAKKPAAVKTAKPAPAKKAAPAAKKAKPASKAKPAKPAKKPAKAVPPAPTPAAETVQQTEKAPETPAPQANNQPSENGNNKE